MLRIQRILLNLTPIPWLLQKSKNWYPPGFEGVALYDVLDFFRRQLTHYNIMERASAVSFNFVMSLPPSLLFLLTLLPNLPFISKRVIKIQLHRLIRDIIPSYTYNKGVIEFVDSFLAANKFGLISFGLLLSLFFASNGMMGVLRSFNNNTYMGFSKRKGLHNRIIAIRLTFVLFGLLLAYFLLLILQGQLLNLLVKNVHLKNIIIYSRWTFIIILLFLAIGFIFRYAPAIKKRWKFISPGVIFSTSLCLLATLGFSYFVSHFAAYNALYGSIGTIMMVMALIFINSLALLLGFELNVSINSLKEISAKRVVNT